MYEFQMTAYSTEESNSAKYAGIFDFRQG